MPDLTQININLQAVMPEISLCIGALAVLLLNALFPKISRQLLVFLSILTLLVSFRLTMNLWGNSITAFSGMFIIDRFSFYAKMLFFIIAFLIIVVSSTYLRDFEFGVGEYLSLILFSTAGMSFIASGADLLIIFLSIEIMSIAFYVLAGFERGNFLSNEASLKYFLVGAFSSVFLLYGIALLYGFAGTSNLRGIASAISTSSSLPVIVFIGTSLLFVGFLFKIAAVPFHMWTPDVYQGAPTPITAFMATAGKVAAFVALVRVIETSFLPFIDNMSEVLWILCAITMTLGNLVALAQTNIKRMLAYSSIAHAGYLLIAFVAMNELFIPSVLFYLFAYALMNIGAFSVVVFLSSKEKEAVNISAYAGIGYKYPLLGVCMTIFMISLAGIPPTAGFMGKFYIFSSAIKSGFVNLAIIGVINSVISVYYYFRIIVYMYMKEPEENWIYGRFSPQLLAVIFSCAAVIMIVGIFPDFVIRLAKISKIAVW
ncbi:MAG: NADH-quinone oxidoreductase subunit N [Candidatus Schekmanbacteria bacterium]|nr:MAG: NADH-quinone oxidoreductase subunit N [Candidatus Schekmanbacteria bacterium]